MATQAPTPTIFIPYHALDDLNQRGTRAAQPPASSVVPGALYCVEDEDNLLERSNGTVWELYAPGSSADLPTAALGKVLVSQGVDVQSVHSSRPVLSGPDQAVGLVVIDESRPADQRRWRLWPSVGYFNFDQENDAGALQARPIFFDRASGQMRWNGAISGPVVVLSNRLELGEVPVANLVVAGQTVGALANFSDSTTNVDGAVIAGSGSHHVFGRWDGSNWRVVGGGAPTDGLGKVLISQGVGTPSVYSHRPELIGPDPSLTLVSDTSFVNQRRMRFLLDQTYGHLYVDAENDVGEWQHRLLTIYRHGGGVIVNSRLDVNAAMLAQYVETSQWTVSLLNASHPKGTLTNVTDSSTNSNGAIVSGGGSHHVLVRWDGTDWRVVGGASVSADDAAIQDIHARLSALEARFS